MQIVPESVLSYFSSAEIVKIAILAESHTSKTFFVELEDFRYVLKQYYPATAYSAVPVNEEALHFLFLSGFDQLCKLLLASDESTNFESADGSIWVAREYIDADTSFDWRKCTWTDKHCREAGALLAEMHARAIYVEHDLELLQVNTSILARSKISYELLLKKSLSSIESMLKTQENSFFESYSTGINERILELFKLLSEGSGNPSQLRTAENWMLSETVLNHGDIHPGNFLFSEGEAVALIDFDFANFNTPAIELGYALFMFAVKDKVGKCDDNKQQFSTDFAKAFLDAYFNRLRRIENIRDYSFDAIMPVLEPRVKLASLYTFFWAADSIDKILSKPTCDTKDEQVRSNDLSSSQSVHSVNHESESTEDGHGQTKAVSDNSDGKCLSLNELCEIARFSFSYFCGS